MPSLAHQYSRIMHMNEQKLLVICISQEENLHWDNTEWSEEVCHIHPRRYAIHSIPTTANAALGTAPTLQLLAHRHRGGLSHRV